MKQIFRQFFDQTSFTYTYLLGDLVSRQAVFIDTVEEQAKRDLNTLKDFGFEYVNLLSTHIHADHITGNALIKDSLRNKAASVISEYYEGAKSDVVVSDGCSLKVGCLELQFLHTPGHTSGCLSVVDHANKRVFTGDTLLIRGCGRTDFQGGSSEKLYDSIHNKLFTLPPDYAVYPAHDYNGCTSSTIGEEMRLNPRLTKTKSEFVNLMAGLNLAYPKMIDVAVPRNLNCGYKGAYRAQENSK